MWLINTTTLQLEMFTGSRNIPPYAILSHTWGKDKDEVTFKEMVPGVESSQTAEKDGFKKIKMTCSLARTQHILDYAWVDTCCIDKSSSAELSEAINSMFKWYQQADVCFAFLEDLEHDSENLAACRWFSRAWTLQELIAPERMQFFDQTWANRGDKHTLCSEIAPISGISKGVLTGRLSLVEVPIAIRMSWASLRQATREEDLTYCLLGIFDVNMPMLYGEGAKAFVRLQLEIIKESADMSIFAWTSSEENPPEHSGLLARSPAAFQKSGALVAFENVLQSSNEISTTNQGIRL
ncbi:HET-domain-containing protein, partial [Cadophora sp. DSE1049]